MKMMKEGALQALAISALALLIICLAAWAEAPEKRPASEADTPDNVTMFGGTPDRNMASDETGIPADWDIESGKNILWSADLGSQTYAGPAVAAGKVYVGTNNEALRNPKLGNDRGVVMTFDAKTGEFLWQIAHPKLPQGRVNDWPLQGICSTPYVEGNRLWYISNRSQIVQADTEGLRNGN
ncbi:MAG: PQQ-binding-like beta-propeller repeat protein, partial [Acidobacteriota bacterium]